MSQLYGKVGYHLPENIAKGGETTIDKSGDGKFIYSGDNFFLNFSLFSFAFGFGLILLLNSKAKLLFQISTPTGKKLRTNNSGN